MNESKTQRQEEQALRYRLLTGKHIEDVREEIEGMFSREVGADLECNPDLSRNPFKMVYQQLNTAYERPPEVMIEDEEADLSPILTARLWAQQQRTCLLTLACNEALVRLDFRHWADADEVSYRVIPPHRVTLKASRFAPDMPSVVEEERVRDNTTTFETWDISDPENPVFKIEVQDGSDRIDVTAKYAPELVGAYPYHDEAGPILPYVLYHKQVSSELWNWSEGMELSRGALRLAALSSHHSDAYTSAAHPQRWALDVDTQAGITRNINGTPVEVIPTDRKSIIRFASKGPSGGQLGQFASAFDVLSSAESLRLFESSLAVYAGLSPSDLEVSSGTSGYAIVLSRSGKRQHQRKISTSLRMSDQLLLATAARLANFYMSTTLPTNPRDYNITYRTLGPTTQEKQAEAALVQTEVQMGVASPLDVVRRLNPEIESDADALAYLLHVRKVQHELDTMPIEGAIEQEITTDTALVLNGAQVVAAQGIVESVALGSLPRDSGVQMLAAFFGMSNTAANAIMGSVGATFTAVDPDAPVTTEPTTEPTTEEQ